MEPRQVLASLVDLAERTGIRVRFDRFDPRTQANNAGGLCIVRGNPTVLLDASASPVDQIAVLAAALARYGVRALYVPQSLRARPLSPTRARRRPAKGTG